MRYRRDLPRALVDAEGPELTQQVCQHIADHLWGVASPLDGAFKDDPNRRPLVHLAIVDHPDDPSMVSITGEINAEPDAPYLRPDFDPTADHPEIRFLPYENPQAGQRIDTAAWSHWRMHGHHERVEL